MSKSTFGKATQPPTPTAPAKQASTGSEKQNLERPQAPTKPMGNGSAALKAAPTAAPKATPAPAPAPTQPVVATRPPAPPPKAPVSAPPAKAPASTPAAETAKSKKVTVSFVLVKPEAKKVALCGEFNQWSPEATPMKGAGNGRWETTVPLAPGKYQYKFVVDGEWLVDPAALENVPNVHGSLNSVRDVRV